MHRFSQAGKDPEGCVGLAPNEKIHISRLHIKQSEIPAVLPDSEEVHEQRRESRQIDSPEMAHIQDDAGLAGADQTANQRVQAIGGLLFPELPSQIEDRYSPRVKRAAFEAGWRRGRTAQTGDV